MQNFVRRIVWLLCLALPAMAQDSKFEISFPASVHAGPITGRVFVALARRDTPPPISQIGGWISQTPFFAADVDDLAPGHAAMIDARATGFPLNSLKELPAGDYYAQALVNIYTQFHRADGHVIWAHMDQWEGQHFNRSPGNMISEVRQVHLDPAAGYDVKLELTGKIPSVAVPPDTAYVKHVKIESQLLTKFWGQPIYLGATVLLPKGFADHPNERYPTIYSQGHFGLNPPFGFNEQPATGGRGQVGYQFYQQWISDDFPRIVAVTFQHPTPYYDDSYAVNSVNNGPYGDALLQELIPYLEEHFRLIRAPYARVLTGGSTGGWESLALQVYHPDFFRGTWTFYPDPVDFRRYQLINVYEDPNAFQVPGYEYNIPERPMQRTPDGQMIATMRQGSQLEDALGTKVRSGQQLAAWIAAYGPIGDDGYPRPLWDLKTGKIDREVALYMRDHGYDLTYHLKQNWVKLGPQLKDQIHLYCGDMDSYDLNLAVYMLEDFLKTTDAAATFEYGRPLKGHGWQPMTNAELVKTMAAHVQKNAPGR